MIRSILIALILTLASTIASAGVALAVGPHLHCLHTPGGTHAIAGGVTANAPHEPAFHNFHFNVHLGALENPDNPVFVTATSPTGTC